MGPCGCTTRTLPDPNCSTCRGVGWIVAPHAALAVMCPDCRLPIPAPMEALIRDMGRADSQGLTPTRELLDVEVPAYLQRIHRLAQDLHAECKSNSVEVVVVYLDAHVRAAGGCIGRSTNRRLAEFVQVMERLDEEFRV